MGGSRPSRSVRANRDLEAEAAVAARQAQQDVGSAVRALLALDVDAQPTTPLALVRGAVRYPTEVLAAAGVRPVDRDPMAARGSPTTCTT